MSEVNARDEAGQTTSVRCWRHRWSAWEDVPNDDEWLPANMEWRVPMQRRRCGRCNRCDHRRTLV